MAPTCAVSASGVDPRSSTAETILCFFYLFSFAVAKTCLIFCRANIKQENEDFGYRGLAIMRINRDR